ncbi:MAG TPA: hypothetical protein VF026_08525 [Ktedonobacteraceae bacterium]
MNELATIIALVISFAFLSAIVGIYLVGRNRRSREVMLITLPDWISALNR